MEESYADLFNSWEIPITKSLISEFLRKYPWLKLEREDLLQECLVHWHFKRKTYDHMRGSAKAYLRQVVKNKLVSILRRELAARRGASSLLVSLDELISEAETLVEEAQSLEIPIDVSIDVRLVTEGLTPFQKQVCLLLGEGYPVAEAARSLNKPRRTVRQEIEKIRRIFSEKGLEDYLR